MCKNHQKSCQSQEIAPMIFLVAWLLFSGEVQNSQIMWQAITSRASLRKLGSSPSESVEIHGIWCDPLKILAGPLEGWTFPTLTLTPKFPTTIINVSWWCPYTMHRIRAILLISWMKVTLCRMLNNSNLGELLLVEVKQCCSTLEINSKKEDFKAE